MSRICVSLSRAGDVSAAPTRRRALRGAAPLAAHSVSLCSRAATPHPGSGSRDPTVLGSCATHPRDHDAPSESSPPGPRVPTRTPSRSYCYERVLLTFVLMMHRAEPLSRGSKLHLSRLPSSATSFDPAGSAEGRRTPREPSPPRSILPTAFDPLGACPTPQEAHVPAEGAPPHKSHASRSTPASLPPLRVDTATFDRAHVILPDAAFRCARARGDRRRASRAPSAAAGAAIFSRVWKRQRRPKDSDTNNNIINFNNHNIML